MKRTWKFALPAVVLALAFVACSKDDDEDPKPTLTHNEMLGEWKFGGYNTKTVSVEGGVETRIETGSAGAVGTLIFDENEEGHRLLYTDYGMNYYHTQYEDGDIVYSDTTWTTVKDTGSWSVVNSDLTISTPMLSYTFDEIEEKTMFELTMVNKSSAGSMESEVRIILKK